MGTDAHFCQSLMHAPHVLLHDRYKTAKGEVDTHNQREKGRSAAAKQSRAQFALETYRRVFEPLLRQVCVPVFALFPPHAFDRLSATIALLP